MNILDTIVERRKEDLAARGLEMGFSVPVERKRPVVPFLPQKGVILEVKRASPSKGDIAPDLDSAATAVRYVAAGAAAISVLTEEHWFKGSLKDLLAVTEAVGTKAAVLRKDFLIHEDEIDIAYRCGADAVLLIARILDEKRIVAMAERCRDLGITALVELKLAEDIEKLKLVAAAVPAETIVCGVNCRDLSNFSIDLLSPSRVLGKIQAILGSDARVVFESGIRTPEAADFAGSLGFSGLLLGEAAARNPKEASALVQSFVGGKATEHSRFFEELVTEGQLSNAAMAERSGPLVKVCGLTSSEDARLAAECGADFLGFIFCSRSPRNVTCLISAMKADIVELRKQTGVKAMAVITETDSEEGMLAIQLQKEGVFDAIQVHGYETALAYLADENLRHQPHYCAVPVREEADLQKLETLRKLGEPRILVDAKVDGLLGGTGVRVEDNLVAAVAAKQKLWLAGGLTPENVAEAVAGCKPELIDVSSGLEKEPGVKDPEKIQKLFAALKK